jgi:hypothetical protein
MLALLAPKWLENADLPGLTCGRVIVHCNDEWTCCVAQFPAQHRLQ